LHHSPKALNSPRNRKRTRSPRSKSPSHKDTGVQTNEDYTDIHGSISNPKSPLYQPDPITVGKDMESYSQPRTEQYSNKHSQHPLSIKSHGSGYPKDFRDPEIEKYNQFTSHSPLNQSVSPGNTYPNRGSKSNPDDINPDRNIPSLMYERTRSPKDPSLGQKATFSNTGDNHERKIPSIMYDKNTKIPLETDDTMHSSTQEALREIERRRKNPTPEDIMRKYGMEPQTSIPSAMFDKSRTNSLNSSV
jgi:hypothetical protein